MYPILLALHNLVRWVVLILAILAVVRAYLGWFGKRAWTGRDRQVGMFTGMAIDIQFLLGLLLHIFFSPLTRSAFQNFGAAMGNPDLRFFALEHVFYMVLAVVFAHLGSILPRKVEGAAAKHQRAAIWFSLMLVVVLLGTPWTRPLLRGF
ncbi:MAG: hypothetical protein AB1894_21050 [Chloroflexota bacterium]